MIPCINIQKVSRKNNDKINAGGKTIIQNKEGNNRMFVNIRNTFNILKVLLLNPAKNELGTQLTFTRSKSTIETLEKWCEICSKCLRFAKAKINISEDKKQNSQEINCYRMKEVSGSKKMMIYLI